MSELIDNKPTANVLMVSMRSMGYSFETAVADVIDNSISAFATEVHIKFPVSPDDCFIAICDNGTGMTSEELFNAMKYGSEREEAEREENDLGRFGLGLKSASLSQCKKLTVISKKDDEYSAYIWDLDIIEQEKDWKVEKCSQKEIDKLESRKYLSYLDTVKHGTIVLWENFDIIEKSSGNVYEELCKSREVTEKYLSLIYHRFLNATNEDRIKIYINNYELKGLDPFLEKHNKTNKRRNITLPIKDSNGTERYISVQPYVLPFISDLGKEDIDNVGGLDDFRTNQGFYIYRNKRLISYGTWFGRRREEITKHARIKVDIPNTLDDIWGLDIIKQKVSIPKVIKNQLSRAVDDAMDVAIKAQRYRGRIEKPDDTIDYIWNRIKERQNVFTYKINRESKIFDIIRNELDDVTWNKVDMVLEEIENNIPYQQIYIDKSQNKIDVENSDEKENEDRLVDVESKAEMLIKISLKFNNNKNEIIDKLFKSEPFNKYPQLKEKLLEEK